MPDGGAHAHVGARGPVRDGVVHGLVRDHFAAFAEQAQEGGRALPRYVIEEFDAFLRSGVLACGFMPCATCCIARSSRRQRSMGQPLPAPRRSLR
nr:hypothetical protein [Deltaproteobacteria bacterium]